MIAHASVKPATFAVNPYGATEKLLRARVKMGTVFRYSLSEEATVTFTVERALAGRKVGRRCRRATRGNRGRPRCTRYRRAGRFAVASKAGRNDKPFAGKIGRKSLAAGRYRVTLAAVDAAGNRSRPRKLKVRVARR